MSTTIRISDETKRRIAEIAASIQRPMTEVIDAAIDAYERKVFLDSFNARYRELRSDPEAWADIEAERRLEEGAFKDASG